MKQVWTAAVILGTFAVLEVVSRLVLHVSDSVTPLIVLPPTIIGGTLLARRTLGRRADGENHEPRE